ANQPTAVRNPRQTKSVGFFAHEIACRIVLTDQVILPPASGQTATDFRRLAPHHLGVVGDGSPVPCTRHVGKYCVDEILLFDSPQQHKICQRGATRGPSGDVLARGNGAAVFHGVHVLREMLSPSLRAAGKPVRPHERRFAKLAAVPVLCCEQFPLLSGREGRCVCCISSCDFPRAKDCKNDPGSYRSRRFRRTAANWQAKSLVASERQCPIDSGGRLREFPFSVRYGAHIPAMMCRTALRTDKEIPDKAKLPMIEIAPCLPVGISGILRSAPATACPLSKPYQDDARTSTVVPGQRRRCGKERGHT